MFNKNCCNKGFVPQPMQPVYEPMVNNCVVKDYYCEVPHICPVNTHTINKVHYVHSYTPKYTCTYETQYVDNNCGCNMYH